MKLMTLNTHSLVEKHYPQKLNDFVQTVAKELPDVIALQEVNQSAHAAAVADYALTGYTPCAENTVIRRDNHVYNAARLLAEQGVRYYWTWLPMKLGYGIFDEGIALMSRSPILAVDTLTVSAVDDYRNWKTRKILGIRPQFAPDEWFFSVHYGFWGDADEPFEAQWQKTAAHMKQYDKVWLMGDFNSPAERRGEGYDLVGCGGWLDSYALARHREGSITVGAVIDGWRERASITGGMRIDQIWVNRPVRVKSSQVIFDGANHPIISDHYGVIVEYERSPDPQ